MTTMKQPTHQQRRLTLLVVATAVVCCTRTTTGFTTTSPQGQSFRTTSSSSTNRIHLYNNTNSEAEQTPESSDDLQSRRVFVSSMIAATALLSTTATAYSSTSIVDFSDSNVNVPRTVLSVDASPDDASSSTTTTIASSTAALVPSAAAESWSGFIAGGTLTATKTIVKYPLDTITVRLQTASSSSNTNLLKNTFRGIVSPLIWNIPSGAVFFAVKDTVQSQLLLATTTDDMNLLTATFLSCLVGNLLAWAIRNPSEVYKTQQQASTTAEEELTQLDDNNNKGNDSSNTLSVSSSSISKFYAGYWENVVMACLGDVIKFMLYDQIMVGHSSGAAGDIALYDAMWAGGAATAVAQYMVTPLDVVRNRIMVNASSSNTKTKKQSGIQLLMEILEQQGPGGLFVGVVPNVAKSTIAGGIQFASYEWTKQTILKLMLTVS